MIRVLIALSFLLFCTSCASRFPAPTTEPHTNALDTASGKQLFQKTFHAHGGAQLDALQDVNVSLSGEWKWLIRRIQPLVTDYGYRIDSQERLFPGDRIYAAQYKGPDGTKSVFRSPTTTQVFYNGEETIEPEVISSSSLTADAFHLFLLGPLALEAWSENFQRLSDDRLGRELYYRVYLQRTPGFGLSASDEVVLWIDKKTQLTKLVQITLEGHESTRGAHVEVEYLDYIEHGGYWFPSKFYERVNAPIAIDAHEWHLTGLDINRGYSVEALIGNQFRDEAAADAIRLPDN